MSGCAIYVRVCMCYTETAPNAWHRRGTQKTGNTYSVDVLGRTILIHGFSFIGDRPGYPFFCCKDHFCKKNNSIFGKSMLCQGVETYKGVC